MSLARRSSRSTSRMPPGSAGNTINGAAESSPMSAVSSNGSFCTQDDTMAGQCQTTLPELVTLEDIEHDEYTSLNSNPTHRIGASPSSPVSTQSELDSDREITYEELKFPVPAPPKHIPFPDVPQNSELLNELVMFVYTSLAASMQFLHLYRTVWWLPESHSSHALVNLNNTYKLIKSTKCVFF